MLFDEDTLAVGAKRLRLCEVKKIYVVRGTGMFQEAVHFFPIQHEVCRSHWQEFVRECPVVKRPVYVPRNRGAHDEGAHHVGSIQDVDQASNVMYNNVVLSGARPCTQGP